jgi:chemotaxis protein MotB
MARRHREEEHENHERWLVSYADFITLLFAFFVVMYAISQVNEGKYRVLSDALINAFKPDGHAPVIIRPPLQPQGPNSGPQPGTVPQIGAQRGDDAVRRVREQRMRTIARDVLQALEPLVKEGQVRVTESARGIAVEINASVLFKSGQAALEPESARALTAVARVLAGTENAIEVEGHTDTERIYTPQFPSNWELSGARASSVVRLFIDSGVAPKRMIASGFSDTRPVDSNGTPEGRARNRRVTVMIRPETDEPVSVLEEKRGGESPAPESAQSPGPGAVEPEANRP